MSYDVFVPTAFSRIEPVFGMNAALEYVARAAGAKSVRIVFFEKGIVPPSPEDAQTIRSTMTMLRLALMRGAVAAYVEDPQRSRCYRIPDGYWSGLSDLEAMHGSFAGMDAAGASEAVIGQPVLLSRNELDVFLFKGPAAEAYPEESPFEPAPFPMNHHVVPTDRTGAPGRPSPMHIITMMFRDRCKQGVALPKLGQEAEALKALYDDDVRYRELARVTAKTIENQLRNDFNRHKSSLSK